MLDATIEGETQRLVTLAHLVRDTGYTFVTPTPATHARVNSRSGHEWAVSLRDVFGWSRPFREGVVPSAMFGVMREAGILRPVAGGWRSVVRLSSLGGLLFLHSAYPTTAADAVFFGPDTYRFAQAIETAIGEASGRPVQRAVDVGCGAGPGAVLLARAFPKADVFGVDINDQALRLTRANAALAGVTVSTQHSDLLSAVPGAFDFIVANPPYLVDPGERAYRHGGGPLGAELSLRILEVALERLAPGGRLLLYTGAAIMDGSDPFLEAVRARLPGPGSRWSYRELDPDVFGEELEGGAYAAAERIAAVLLTVDKKWTDNDA